MRRNILDQKINKRVVQKMLEQASKYNLDVQDMGQSTDITTTYNSLMKSLNFIYLILSQVVAGIDLKATEEVQEMNKKAIDRKLHRKKQGYEEENPNIYEEDINSRFGRIGSLGSEYPFSLGSRSNVPSEYEEIEFENPSEYGDEPSEYGDDPEILYGYPKKKSRDGSVISSLSGLSGLSKFTEIESAVSLNSLEKEVVNTKFYVDQLIGQFNLLTKVQKQKLTIIISKINKQINHISRIYPKGTKKFTQLNESFIYLNSSIEIIKKELKSFGEGDILDKGYYEGAGISRKIFNSHQPSKYVNQNFLYNLAQRNN